MKRIYLTSLLGILSIAPAYGDFLPIAGSTLGGFSNATGGSSISQAGGLEV